LFRCVWIFCDVMIMMLDLTWRLFSQYRWHQIHYFAMSFFRPFPRFFNICLSSLISVSRVVDVHSFELMHTPLLFFSFKSHVHTKSYVLKSRPYSSLIFTWFELPFRLSSWFSTYCFKISNEDKSVFFTHSMVLRLFKLELLFILICI